MHGVPGMSYMAGLPSLSGLPGVPGLPGSAVLGAQGPGIGSPGSPAAFLGEWPSKIVCWGQIDRQFKLALLGATGSNLYNPALMGMPQQRPSDLEVEAAVAFVFQKFPGSIVEWYNRSHYANMLLTHIKAQPISPLEGKNREDVFKAGMDMLQQKELESIKSSQVGLTTGLPGWHGTGMMAGQYAALPAGMPSCQLAAGPAQHAKEPVGAIPVVITHPGRRSILVMGEKSRELRRSASGGADTGWTVAEDHVVNVEAGLFASVAECLSDTSTPWPELPPSKNEVPEQETLNKLKRKLADTTALANAAKQKLDQDEGDLDKMLQEAEAEVWALEARAII